MDIHHGGCACGAVRFTVWGPLRAVIYCHCSQCRRQSGHYLGATAAAEEALSVTGADALTWFRSSGEAARAFCSRCGSGLFWKADGRATISILAGGFDSPSDLAGSHHIFVADKGDYYTIDDGLPQHEAGG